ncbi:hypothetical protein X743_18385 [Mesorhizobium sp. LNHC252B00]|nr:hypothetical protein X743_18385 [Mesorhizobium sp. LNHC252B00]
MRISLLFVGIPEFRLQSFQGGMRGERSIEDEAPQADGRPSSSGLGGAATQPIGRLHKRIPMPRR